MPYGPHKQDGTGKSESSGSASTYCGTVQIHGPTDPGSAAFRSNQNNLVASVGVTLILPSVMQCTFRKFITVVACGKLHYRITRRISDLIQTCVSSNVSIQNIYYFGKNKVKIAQDTGIFDGWTFME